MAGGGFGMPAKITYTDHRTRGKMLSEKFGIDLDDIGGKGNAREDFSYLNYHTGTHFDAQWHCTDVSGGKPSLTIDQVLLEWCFGNGVWFGVIFVMNCEMAYLTPPVGIDLYVLRGIVPEEIKTSDIFRAVAPFVSLQALGLAIVMIFPQLALYIPTTMRG